jgi:hypothetical protein
MRILKIIIGLGCFVAALFLGLLVLGEFTISSDWPFVLCAVAFAGAGRFLIAKRNSPMSKKAKIVIVPTICLLIGFVIAVGIPKFIQNRQQSIRLACLNHLIQIDGAKQQWRLEHNKTGTDIPTWEDLKPYIAGSIELKCPAGGTYTIGKVDVPPTCSITNHSLD